MSWFETFMGGAVGFVLGGPLGAVAGAALANILGRRVARMTRASAGAKSTSFNETQGAYFVTFFTLLGKFAKIDGRVSVEEGEQLLQFLDEMKIPPQPREFAISLFNEGKDSQYRIEELAEHFYRLVPQRPDIHTTMLEMLYRMAAADKELHPAEERELHRIAQIFHIAASQQQQLRNRYFLQEEKYYAVLGVSPHASEEELRNAYRQKVKEFHPDRIMSHGLPPEFSQFAARRFREIQEAWEVVKRERRFS